MQQTQSVIGKQKRQNISIETIHDSKKQKIQKNNEKSSLNNHSKFWNVNLPIYQCRQEIIESVKNHTTTIVVGETGSGKSTQIPQYLIDAGKQIGLRKISCVCTQPRRVAAITIASQVAKERQNHVGREVGYTIRFEDVCSSQTRIKYVTDGVLLREMMSDMQLSNYGVVILDEVHERSLQTDIVMGLLKQLQVDQQKLQLQHRLKLVVMSATVDVDFFCQFFEDCQVVRVAGRQFPVTIYYMRDPEPDYVDAALLTCLQV
jgi:HrpA-like RNA helicase